MVILSVDYGDVRTGIAVCDKNEILASPVCVITERSREALVEKVHRLAVEKEAECLVVGLPKNMDGTEGFRAEACKAFADVLQQACGDIPVLLRDERLTTVSASRYLNETNTRGARRKGVLDTLSAQIILQNMLDRLRNAGGAG